jgi:hypothetical protein
MERYEYKRGKWSCLKPQMFNLVGSMLLGYVIKRMEAKMRAILRYKHRLSPNTRSVITALQNSGVKSKRIYELLEDPLLDQTIDQAVVSFFNDNLTLLKGSGTAPRRVVVSIDVNKLDKIRSEALDIQEKLIVSDEALPVEETIPQQTPPPEPVSVDSEGEDEWTCLKADLSPVQRQAIGVILSGRDVTEKLLSLATENGMLVEVLLEEVNEKALEYIGDNIIETLETPVYIYEDYYGDVDRNFGRD